MLTRLLALGFFAGTLAILPLYLGGVAGCGAATTESTTNASSTAAVKSLSKLPDISTLVNTGSSSSSSLKGAVTGTPPLLKDFTATTADTYFWNGLIAKINAASSVTSDQINSFWAGEGACRMAQVVGYSFQNILEGGVSLCYMKNAPTASNGVTIDSGSSSLSELFSQGSSSKTIRVREKGFTDPSTGKVGEEDIYITVLGTGTTEGSAGYAVDLWFCPAGSATANGYEKIRLDSSSSLAVTHVDTGFGGTFVGKITATVKKSGDDFVFDAAKSKTTDVYFSQTGTSNTFKGNVTIDNGKLTGRDYQKGSFNSGPSMTSKRAIYAQYGGNTMDTLRMQAAGFALEDVFSGTTEVIVGATEYQGAVYAPVSSGDLYTLAKAEKFTDSLYSSDVTTYTTLASALNGYSCSVASPDVVVSMDFSQSGPQAVATKCEIVFRNMDFCDSSSVNSARQKVISAQTAGSSCSTARCSTGDDFSCQRWADNNLGNSQGLTTANAGCSSGCCAAVR